ncbi:MAG: bacillithiol biosynthesis deacetylase BshB1 [Psychroserpens sp.]|jgi:bacillithiol biosynthesis deacetylase BshB1
MSNKVDILAFGAHPDDVECAVSGTLLKHIALGKTVAIIDLTAGETGSHGTPVTRLIESQNAAQILGVSHREQLGMKDGSISNDETNRLLVIKAIRKFQPSIVLANALKDNHPDHAASAKLVADAAFLSGLKKIETIENGISQEKWKPSVVYHYIQDQFIEPDFVIDISEHMDNKMESIRAYASQFIDPKTNSPNSIIGLLDQIISMNSIYGRPINSKYAEGFNVSRYIGTENFYNLS